MAEGYYGGGIPITDLDFGFQRYKCCDNLFFYNRNYCCGRHNEIIGSVVDKTITMGTVMYCGQYKETNNCYIEMKNKIAKEQAEKERKAREEKIKQEKADILQRYEQRIRSNPDDVDIYRQRGYEYVGKGYYDLAIADFTTMLQKNPKDAETHQILGSVYSQMEEYDNAIKSYNEAIRINPKEAEAYAFRGETYSQKGEDNQALTDFEKAIQLNPKCKNAFVFRGNMYFMKGVQNKENANYDQSLIEIDKAIADGEEALRLVPEDFSATDLLKRLRNEKEVVNRMIQDAAKGKKNIVVKIICCFLPIIGPAIIAAIEQDTDGMSNIVNIVHSVIFFILMIVSGEIIAGFFTGLVFYGVTKLISWIVYKISDKIRGG